MGPRKQLRTQAGFGWDVVADETRDGRWDVYAEHVAGDGTRVPPGRNDHAAPGLEMDRLVSVVAS